MAIESLKDKTLNTATDVWSFGVLLWELFSLAEEPYPGVPNAMMLQRLVDGHRMLRPPFATHDAYRLMRECWNSEPLGRPSFAEIIRILFQILPVEVWEQCGACLDAGYERPMSGEVIAGRFSTALSDIFKCPEESAPLRPEDLPERFVKVMLDTE